MTWGKATCKARFVKRSAEPDVRVTNEDAGPAQLVELDPRYVDVIVQRWQGTTGGSAWLNGSRKRFSASTEKPQAADSKIG